MASHSLGIIPLSLSKLFERFAYYGMRSILTLYMVNQLALEEHKASSIYGFLILAVGVLPILGGIIGDLLLSTKLTAIIGGFIQALGFFTLALPSQAGIYLGLLLIALGSGLYSPNLISTIGSIYKSRKEKLDAALLIFYMTINLGAFFGAFFIIYISDYLGYKIAFIACGIIMIGAQLILILSNKLLLETPSTANFYLKEEKNEANDATRVFILIATILLIPIFWIIYQISNNSIYDRFSEIQSYFSSFFTIFEFVSAFSIVLVGIILVIIYSFAKTSSFLKIFIGFTIYALSCALIGLCAQMVMSNSYLIFILVAVFLQSISELFISPIAYSIICKYGPAKFNSTLIGVHIAANSVFAYATSGILMNLRDIPTLAITVILIGTLAIFAAVFLVLYFVTKQKNITS